MSVGAQQATRRVLILTGTEPIRPGFGILTSNIQSILRDRSSSRVELLYELQQELLDPARSQTGDEELTSYLKRKYANERIDLVIVIVAPRFRILAQKDPTLFGNIPKIFYDYDNEREAANRALGPNITGVWSSLDRHRATLDLALALNPDARKVVVISGASPQNKLVLERMQADFRPYESRAEFSYLTGETIEELKRQLAALDKRSIVIFASLSTDKIGNNYIEPEALSMLAPTSGAPIYGSAETYMGQGITGGRLLDFETTGKRIAEMSLRVLAGERVEQIPQETAPSVTTVDWREMQRWQLSENRLPPGTVIKFKQPTFWQAYKWNAIGLVALIILEAILIAWLLALRTRRRQAEEESLRLAQLANTEHKRLDEIISNVPGIVWESLIDPETNQRKTTFISDYVRRMLGYTPKEWIAAAPGLGLRIMSDEDRERANRESEAVIASGRDGVIQFRWLDKEGRIVWTESYLSPIKDSDQKVIGLRGVTLDITQRKLAEQALRHAEERDRAILNAIPDIMFVQTLDGVFVDYHAKDSNDLFVPPQTFLGKNMRDILPPEVGEQIAECFANAADGGEPQILEYTLPMNGTDRWFEARMVRSGENILTVVRDITERMLSEEALRAERELLEALVGQLPASVGLIRGSDLRIQIVNPAYQAIAPGKEMLGKTMDELWPEAGQNFEAICRQVLETGEPYQVTDELTTIRRSPDGPLESGYFSWSLHRVRLPGGNGWGLLNTGWETTQRKQTEKTLSEREQLLKAMFGSLSSHVVVLDPSGTITYANRLWNEFAIANGCEVTTVSTGVNYLEVCQRAVNKGDESSRPVVEGIRAVITGRLPSFRVEYDCHSPDEKRWFLMQVDPMPPEHGGVVVVHTNVTDRKQAEQALRESEERFSKAFRANPQPMTISTLAEGRYLDVNDAFLEVSGYTRAEVIGHTSLELGIWERPENRLDFLRKINERGSVVNFESRFRTKDGSLRVLLYSAERLELGGVDCLIGASSDITDRQKAQDALRESRARLVLAYQAANMGTFEWNVQTGMNTWSAELEAMYGLERGTFPGTQSAWQELVHPEDREKALDGVNRAFKTGEPEDEEWRVTWPDGSVHWIYGRYQVFRTAAGVPERLTGINIDITNRKAAESAVRESEERFRNMADTVPAMIWVSGPDKLVTYVNQQWLDFTGRTMEEELGNGWAAGVHPDDFDRCLETYCNAFDRREPFRMEYRLKRADSRFRWVIDSASASFSPAGEFLGYIGSCVDITDRKESEESLRMAHEEVSRLKNQLQEENVYLQEEISLHKNFDEIIGDSDALKYVLFKIEQVAPTDSTVLITGETGTGKELVASAIHKASTRSDRPMVRVNCGALSQSLIESELFGHEKGAFTGASTSKIGRFELANGATIFLDEIGELPQESQVKLLRVIQEGEFERLGSARTIKVDVRIIAATNRNLDLEVKKGLFREDLWYRLNVFPITVPPLRQRREDIPVLVEHFVNKFARKLGKVITSISPSTMKSLRDYSWRGNIRELANVIERAVINSKGPVLRIGEDFLVESTEQTSSTTRTLEEMEREYILRVLEDRAWRIEGPHGAARLLGLNPSTLRTRLIKLGINRETVFKSDKEFGLVSS